jgi:hypothetical protein
VAPLDFTEWGGYDDFTGVFILCGEAPMVCRPNRKIYLTIVVLSTLLASACYFVARTPQTMPMLVAEELPHLGTVGQFEKIPVQFKIKNTTNQPIVVNDLLRGCKCQEVQLPEKPLQPGEEFIVKLLWHTSSLKGQIAYELQLKWLQNEQIHLTKVLLHANVEPDFWCEPHKYTFAPDGPTTCVIVLTPHKLKDLEIHSVASNYAGLGAELQADKRSVMIRYTPKQWPNYYTGGIITLKTNSVFEPTVEIEIGIRPTAQPERRREF